MKFPYPGFEIEGSESGISTTIYRPVVPIVIHGPTRSMLLRALLDTGADYTVLPISVAKLCGVDLDRKQGIHVTGVGGSELAIFPGNSDFEFISQHHERHRWQATAYYGEEEGILLGQLGCLEFFTATFDYQAKGVELNWNTELQGQT